MGIFDWFKGGNKTEDSTVYMEPKVVFGRYSEWNKTRAQLDCWEKSIRLFKEKRYSDAYTEFLNYLKNETSQNVNFTREGNRIEFSLIQGSKVISGLLTEREVQAEAEVVRFEKQDTEVMHKLLVENYSLYFSKYAIKNDVYTIKFYAPSEDMHPLSLHNALKELATVADSYDDVLVADFAWLHAINTEHIEQLSEAEIKTKLYYFRTWIKEGLERTDVLDSVSEKQLISYVLITLAYKIYHLLAPEGALLDDIKLLHTWFYKENGRGLDEKNQKLKETFKTLLNQSDNEIKASFYKVKATFSITQPVNQQTVVDFIKKELNENKKYIENKDPEKLQSVLEYILSYSCFQFDLPDFLNDLLMILWRVYNPEFFNDLGFRNSFFELSGQTLNKELIATRIQHILSHSKRGSMQKSFKLNRLDFSGRNQFAVSFFNELQNLKYD